MSSVGGGRVHYWSGTEHGAARGVSRPGVQVLCDNKRQDVKVSVLGSSLFGGLLLPSVWLYPLSGLAQVLRGWIGDRNSALKGHFPRT